MTERRNHIAAVVACAVLVFAGTIHAGTVVDLAQEDAPFIRGGALDEQFGYCVAVGDLDGDGSFELVVGAPGIADSSSGQHEGAVFVFHSAALDTLSGGVLASSLAERTIFGSSDHGRFGSAVAVADLDADGFDDLVVGAPHVSEEGSIARGEVSVYFGSASGPASPDREALPDAVLTGATPGARLGASLLARDIDGDGAAELLVSAPVGGGTAGARPGAVYVVSGAALRSLTDASDITSVAAAVVLGENAGDELMGLGVADTDGDGGLELVLGASQADGAGAGLTDAGGLYVVPALEAMQASAPLQLSGYNALHGITERGFFGRSISVGDLNYDGADDILVSAYASKAGGKRTEATGEVFLLLGGEGWPGVPSLDDPAVPRFSGATKSDMLGLPVLLADVNGDGADDVIAASRFADGPDNKRSACGEVYVYKGSLRSVMAAKAGSAELADMTVIGENPGDAIGASLLVWHREGASTTLLLGAPDAPGLNVDGEVIPRGGKLILLPVDSLLR